ncbi:MAG: hypothetical protein L6R40_000183 [Gallowayella cf. fulva]|nr:MAG: hypothetical protein L6R40_000183 [Xanthomendoza cf. fulva]
MAYTDDAVKAKLSSLNETQESIVSVSQWIMFHRRHADRTCAIWLERMRETTANKRLTLIYLANEVVQQSKARRKDDFLVAFSPVIAEATATAYKGATNDVQEKIRRTVEVWSQRRIFDKPIQEAVEGRILELDKSRSGKKSGLLGSSLFPTGSSNISAPAELQPLIPLQTAVTKANATTNPTLSTANAEYERSTDPDKPIPTPPVHAARLSALLKSLSSAETAVAESIKTRQDLIKGFEDILATNRAALEEEQAQLFTTTDRRETIEKKKREVEDAIMRGVSATATPTPGMDGNAHVNGRATSSAEPERPQVEELTPPSTESLTPITNPTAEDIPGLTHHPNVEDSTRPLQYPPIDPSSVPTTSPRFAENRLPPPQPSTSSSSDPRYTASSPTKKRKLDAEFEGFGAGDDAMAGLDDDVAELLRAETGGVV